MEREEQLAKHKRELGAIKDKMHVLVYTMSKKLGNRQTIKIREAELLVALTKDWQDIMNRINKLRGEAQN